MINLISNTMIVYFEVKYLEFDNQKNN